MKPCTRHSYPLALLLIALCTWPLTSRSADYPPLLPGMPVPKPKLWSPKASEQQTTAMVRAVPAVVVIPQGFTITNISLANGQTTLAWQLGQPPFQVYGSPDLIGWSPVGDITQARTSTFPVGQNHFWKVRDQAQAGTPGSVAWARNYGSPGAVVYGAAVDVASNGDVLLGTIFSGTVDLTGTGIGINGVSKFTSAGGQDIAFSRYTSSGAFVWAKHYGTTGNETIKAIKFDSAGNVIAVGAFSGTGDVGGGPMTSAGLNDLFVAKYSALGDFVWSKHFGGNKDDLPFGVAVDSADNVVFGCNYASQDGITFGGDTFSSGSGSLHACAVKLSGANGSHIWSKDFQTQGQSTGSGLCLDGNGNVFVAASLAGIMNFGNGPLSTISGMGAVIGKLSATDGTGTSSKMFGGTDGTRNQSFGVSADAVGSVFLVGSFASPSFNLGCGALTSQNFDDNTFVAKLSVSDLSCVWSKGSSSTLGGSSTSKAVTVDASSGNVMLTGLFNRNVTFGANTLTTPSGNQGSYVVKYGSGGALQWTTGFSGLNATDFVNSLAQDSNYVAGLFGGTDSFGAIGLMASGVYDGFITRLNP